MKKIVISFVILIIFCAAVFIFGWLEFFVPVDKVGVMISKTGGTKAEVIQAGNFTWSWERLIPTNSKIRIFSAVPQSFSKKISGSLPSAEIYKNMLEGSPNFSYNFSVEMELNIKTSALPAFVERTGATEQADLDAYLNSQAEKIARDTIEHVLEESMRNPDYVIFASLSDNQIIDGINATSKYNDVIISSIQINDITLPDVTMYNHAKNSYDIYQETIQVALEDSFELQGFDAAKDYLELERLSRLGRILMEYPQLIDFMAVSNGNLEFELPTDIPQVNELSR